jgi:hypothetical protein
VPTQAPFLGPSRRGSETTVTCLLLGASTRSPPFRTRGCGCGCGTPVPAPNARATSGDEAWRARRIGDSADVVGAEVDNRQAKRIPRHGGRVHRRSLHVPGNRNPAHPCLNQGCQERARSPVGGGTVVGVPGRPDRLRFGGPHQVMADDRWHHDVLPEHVVGICVEQVSRWLVSVGPGQDSARRPERAWDRLGDHLGSRREGDGPVTAVVVQ